MNLASPIVIARVDNFGSRLCRMDGGKLIQEAREKRNWSQADLARRVGISQAAVNKIEKGRTGHSKFLPHIAAVLDLDLRKIDPSITAERPYLSRDQIQGPGADFPIHASAEGGKGEIIMTTEAVDYVPTPAPLLHVREAYGLLVVGTSMQPEYRPGDTALVHPHLPVIGGEVYIFYAEREGAARATIKELRRASSETWYVRQHNPPEGSPHDFTLSRREWQWAHRVIGKYSRR